MEVEKHIDEGNLMREFKMSALPSLYDHFVKLIGFLVRFKLLVYNKVSQFDEWS